MRTVDISRTAIAGELNGLPSLALWLCSAHNRLAAFADNRLIARSKVEVDEPVAVGVRQVQAACILCEAIVPVERLNCLSGDDFDDWFDIGKPSEIAVMRNHDSQVEIAISQIWKQRLKRVVRENLALSPRGLRTPFSHFSVSLAH